MRLIRGTTNGSNGWTSRAFCLTAGALFGLGCATAHPPPASSQTQATVRESGPGADPTARFEIPATPLGGPDGLARLCEAVRRPAPGASAGEAEADVQAGAHEENRTQAIEMRYQADVPPHGFAFATRDAEDGVLLLGDHGFSLDEAAVIDRPPGQDPVAFAVGEEAAQRLLQMHAERRVFLRVVFVPQPTQLRPDACLRQSGGRSLKLSTHIEAAYLMGPLGTVLARYETDGFAQVMAQATPVATPAVAIGKPMSSDATPVPSSYEQALAKLEEPLLACYREALVRKPSLQGKLVVAIHRGQTPRMELATFADDELLACAMDRVGKVPLAGGATMPAGVSLPITFGPSP